MSSSPLRALGAATMIVPAFGLVALSAPTAAATPPRPAVAAGSIVYIKGNNVYLARGDGSAARRITTDGTARAPYHSPSESDAGVVAVAHGTVIVRMTQAGKVLNRIDPPPLRNSAGESMNGAVNDVALSPDGTKIAWSFVR